MRPLRTEKELKKILNKDVVLPKIVEDRLDETFSTLKSASSPSKPHKTFYHTAKRFSLVAACGILLFLIFGFSNPALASKLPFIGALFQTEPSSYAYESVIQYLQGTKDWGYPGALHNNRIDSKDYITVHHKLSPQISSDVYGVEFYLEEIFCNGYDFLITYRIFDPNQEFFSNAIALTNKSGGPVMSINGVSLDTFQSYLDLAFENTLFAKRVSDDTFVGYAYCNISLPNYAELFASLKQEQEFSFSLQVSELYNESFQENTTLDGFAYVTKYTNFVPITFLDNKWSITYTAPISRANVISYDFTEDTDLFTTASLVTTSCSTHILFDGIPDSSLEEDCQFFFLPSLSHGHLDFHFISASPSSFSYQADSGVLPKEAEQFQITLYATKDSPTSKNTANSQILFQKTVDLKN